MYRKRQSGHLLVAMVRLLKAGAVEAGDVFNTVVADDSALMRRAIKDAVRAIPGCAVVGEAANGLEALELVRLYLPDLVVLDINMPVMGGMETLSLLKREQPDIHVVMVSSILEQEMRDHVLGLGAYACVEKGPELWERLPAIVAELAMKCPAKT